MQISVGRGLGQSVVTLVVLLVAALLIGLAIPLLVGRLSLLSTLVVVVMTGALAWALLKLQRAVILLLVTALFFGFLRGSVRQTINMGGYEFALIGLIKDLLLLVILFAVYRALYAERRIFSTHPVFWQVFVAYFAYLGFLTLRSGNVLVGLYDFRGRFLNVVPVFAGLLIVWRGDFGFMRRLVPLLAWLTLPMVGMAVYQSTLGPAQWFAIAPYLTSGDEWMSLGGSPFIAGDTYLRVFSFAGNPNLFGHYMVLLFFLFAEFLYHPEFRHQRTLLSLAMLASAVGLLLSYSRSSWLAWMAGSFFFAWQRRDWRFLLVVIAIVSLIAIAAPEVFASRFLSSFRDQADIAGRTNKWAVVFNQPLLVLVAGIGLGRFGAIGTGGPVHAYQGVSVVDNNYLTMLLESGIVGLGLFLLLLYYIWRSARNLGKQSSNMWYVSLANICQYTLIVTCVLGVFVEIWYCYYAYFFWLICGFVLGVQDRLGSSSQLAPGDIQYLSGGGV